GFNSRWVVVQGNLFAISDGSFQATRIYAFDKAMLYAGAGAPHTTFTRGDILSDQIPAVTLDASLADMYLVSSWDGDSAGRGLLRLFTISGELGAEVLAVGPLVATASPWAIAPRGFDDFAPQKGTARRISAGD